MHGIGRKFRTYWDVGWYERVMGDWVVGGYVDAQ
jgi:hypothetical protein